MPMRRILQSPEFNLAASAIATAAATALSFSWLGFVGVLLVGLFIGLAAVRVELGTSDPIGVLGLESLTPEQRAEIRAGVASRSKLLSLVKLLGLALTLVGGIGFFALQLPHRSERRPGRPASCPAGSVSCGRGSGARSRSAMVAGLRSGGASGARVRADGSG